MKQQVILLILLTTLLISGCAVSASPVEPSLASSTPAIFFTSTLHPAPTATETEEKPKATEPVIRLTLTPTLEPSLKTEGPYLGYFRYVADTYQLVLLDANGEGRKVIPLPKEIMDSFMYDEHQPDTKLLSPDGHWLAFYTGTAGSYSEMPAPGTANLTLNLLNLETGEQQVVANLLSKDYPNNFAQAAEKLNTPDITAESLYEAFQNGFTNSIAWSPDGQTLAFAGQMDGLSSDLYVYDVNTKEIRRLSSGDQELQWINWSPDGRWILHGSVLWVGEGMSFDVYAAAADGSSVPHISVSSLYGGISEWVNDHEYLEHDNQNVLGDFGLRSVDIDTGKIRSIWKGSFLSYGMDPGGKWIVLMPFSADVDPTSPADSDPTFQTGFYLVNLKTMEKTPIPGSPVKLDINHDALPANPNQEIVLLNYPGGTNAFYLSDTGEVTSYDLGNSRVSISPNQKYWVALAGQEIRVLSMENVELKKIPLSTSYDLNTFDISWRPDDSGFFLVGSKDIYSIDIGTSQTRLVETNRMDNFGFPRWMGGQ